LSLHSVILSYKENMPNSFHISSFNNRSVLVQRLTLRRYFSALLF
jgi:hypothetical protein